MTTAASSAAPAAAAPAAERVAGPVCFLADLLGVFFALSGGDEAVSRVAQADCRA